LLIAQTGFGVPETKRLRRYIDLRGTCSALFYPPILSGGFTTAGEVLWWKAGDGAQPSADTAVVAMRLYSGSIRFVTADLGAETVPE
jgi:hypothetical protein